MENNNYRGLNYQGLDNQSDNYQEPVQQVNNYQEPVQQANNYREPVQQTNNYQAPAQQANNYQPNAPVYANEAARPMYQLKTNRGLIKFILLSIITFGIYSLVAMSSVSSDINLIAGRYDGKKTMHYCLLTFVVFPLTLGIGGIVWFHRISKRIGNEIKRRGIDYHIGAGSFWLWNTLGVLILVGPLVYLHKFFKAMNLLAEDFNVNG